MQQQQQQLPHKSLPLKAGSGLVDGCLHPCLEDEETEAQQPALPGRGWQKRGEARLGWFPGEGQASRNTWSLPRSPPPHLALQIGFDLPCPAFELLPVQPETTEGGGGAGSGQPRPCGRGLRSVCTVGAQAGHPTSGRKAPRGHPFTLGLAAPSGSSFPPR